MRSKELLSMYIKNEHGTFTPIYEYEHYDQETDSYTGFKVIKTAEEVYNEWLSSKDKPIEPQEPNEMEVLRSQLDELSEYTLLIEMKNIELEEQTTLNSEYVLDLDTRLIMLENKQI